MKYFLRFIAAIPALCVGISSMIMFFFMLEHKLLLIPLIGCIFGFIYLLDKVEDMADEFADDIYSLIGKHHDSKKISKI